nr:methyl-accepting chemotaxis protein [Paenibacillus sp. EZ-K15]
MEASRAGEHGRGFAVVAGEVKKLAEQSSKSAQQITSYVESIQEGIQNAVQSMEQGTREVTEALHLVTQAGSSFNETMEEVTSSANVLSSMEEELQEKIRQFKL